MSDDLKYNYIPASEENRKTHMWTLVGPLGAVHIWAAPQPESPFKSGEFYGGVECHFPAPPSEYSPQEAPICDCWLTGKPCWPDGSSLAFTDNIEPFLRHARRPFPDGVHSYINNILLDWYEVQFCKATGDT